MPENDSDILLDEMVKSFQKNFKNVAKDLLDGVEWLRLAGTALLGIAAIVAAYTFILARSGYYSTSQLYGQASIVASGIMVGVLIVFFVYLRRELSIRKKKYADLYRLLDKINAK